MPKLFTLKTWLDEILSGSERYDIKEDNGASYKSNMQIQLATSVAQAGDAINATELNRLENGINDLDTKLADAQDLLVTGGSSTNLTITTIGDAALVMGECFRVKFHTTAGASPTLNRDGKGAKSLKYYDATGTKIACSASTIVSGLIANVIYDGVDYVLLNPVGGGVTDHGALTGLLDNDHPQYSLLSDGSWIPSSATWAYVSPSTFMINGDHTNVYVTGTYLKFTQTTNKYATVVSSSYSAPNTIVNIAANTDHTIANAAITSPYYSYSEKPPGHPLAYNFSPSWTNLTVANGVLTTKLSLKGKQVDGHINLVFGSLTSISGAVSIATPITTSIATDYSAIGAIGLVDAGVALYMGEAILRGNNTIDVRVIGAGGTYATWGSISSGVPFTWAVTTNPDILDMNFSYHL